MKLLILFAFFALLIFPFQVFGQGKQVIYGPEESEFKSQLEQSLERIRESYLKLPKKNITYVDVENLKSDIEFLEKVVGDIHLGNFSIKEVTEPLKKLDKAFRRLKKRNKYSQASVAEIRRWSNYLVQAPITQTFLAKDDVIHGREALLEKRFAEAKGYFQRAADHLLKIKNRIPAKLRGPIQRIESELTIYFTASVREEILEKKRERGVLRAISRGFDTYHDSTFNMWSDIPAIERY